MSAEAQVHPSNPLIHVLEEHAAAVLLRSPTSMLYADRVRQNIAALQEAMREGEGFIEGAVTTWRNDMSRIMEVIMGVVVSEDELNDVVDTGYQTTLINGVYGRVRRVSLDEIMGPMLALDIAVGETHSAQDDASSHHAHPAAQ